VHVAREKRAVAGQLTTLSAGVAATGAGDPRGRVRGGGMSRVLAAKAQVSTGARARRTRYGICRRTRDGPSEAVGLRLEGSRLRLAETVRVKSATLVHHVAVEPRDEEGDLDVRIDADDARTVIGAGDAPPFRIVARGAHVLGLVDDPHGVRPHPLWPLPPAQPFARRTVVRLCARSDAMMAARSSRFAGRQRFGSA